LYFFGRVVFAFDAATARVAAWLIGLSAPVAMSYLYFYFGQNAGLAALVATLSAGFLLLTRPDARLAVFFSLMVNALLVTYLGVIVYPFQSSWYFEHFGPGIVIVAFVLTVAVAGFVLYCIARWARETDRARAVTILGALVIYAAVWWIYSFQRQYGYAVFKMS